MATQLQLRRGTNAQVTAFTGAEGEVSVNTTNDSLHVHDGSTAGGFELARADLNNVSDTDLNAALTGNTVSALTVTALTTAGLTTTGNISFGDNDKAIFGAGSDLQIYHDGTSSTSYFIESNATGNMEFRASSLRLKEGDGGNYYFLGVAGGASTVYHNGSAKLATTATGIDVTGTVTADGLTVDGNASIGTSGTSVLDFERSGANYIRANNSGTGRLHLGAGGDLRLHTGQADNDFTENERIRISSNGDISFYNSAGTSQSLFWDASAESLGIGTSSPATPLHINTNVQAVAQLESTHANGSYAIWAVGGTKFGDVGSKKGISGTGNTTDFMVASRSTYPLVLGTGSTERMRIDSSGNVGIGTSSPASILELSSSTAPVITLDSTDNTGQRGLAFQYNGASYGQIGQDVQTGELRIRSGESGQSGYYIKFDTNGSEAMRIDSSGNVGIGMTPASGVLLDLKEPGSSSDLIVGLSAGTGARAQLRSIAQSDGTSSAVSIHTTSGGATSERMRIDSSGNLLVGKTASGLNTAGFEVASSGRTRLTRDSANVVEVNRKTNDGSLVTFSKDGTSVGSIGSVGGTALSINSVGTGKLQANGSDRYAWDSSQFYPTDDNLRDLGFSTFRWDDVYATNGTIQTSDRNEKQDIEALSDAEQRVAVAAKGLLRKFRWINSVEEKGDDARIHFGIIAQDLQAAFEAEGLDAGRYAMFINTTWTDEETGEERSRMGVRYSELLAFIIAAI